MAEHDTITVTVRAHPRSRVERLAFEGDVLHVWVAAAPVEGAANDAIVALVARVAGVARSRVTVLRGATKRHKRLTISGVSAEDLRDRVAATKTESAAK